MAATVYIEVTAIQRPGIARVHCTHLQACTRTPTHTRPLPDCPQSVSGQAVPHEAGESGERKQKRGDSGRDQQEDAESSGGSTHEEHSSTQGQSVCVGREHCD